MLSGVAAFSAAAKDPGGFPDHFLYGTVRYHIDEDVVKTQSMRSGKTVELPSEYAMQQYDDRILVGWQTDCVDAYYYDNTDFWRSNGQTDLTVPSGETCDLYPIWCPIALRKEEVFSFTNSESVFNADLDGYLFTRQQFLRIIPNWMFAFALSPFAPLAAAACAFTVLIWPTMDFYGSCCGFATAALLQHYGKIDMLSGQGVSNVCELEPDENVQSTINYYNIHAVPGFLTNHIAALPGTQEYTTQLHALYDTLENGTPVYFELYGDGPHMLRRIVLDPISIAEDFSDLTAHGVVLTGAYTDGNGNHILIMYDNNSRDYVNGGCDIVYIDPDFTQIYSSYGSWDDDVLDGFSWNECVDQFDTFRTQGVSNPFSWHIQFMRNLPSLVQQIAAILKTR